MTLLHPPYTLWHLSYVALGAALAPTMKWGLLGWTVLAFLLAMGVGAHALDELQRPAAAHADPGRVLVALAACSVAGACAIGVVVATRSTLWLLAFVAFGAFVVVGLQPRAVRRRDPLGLWFALAWGAFPVLTAYFASAERIRAEAAAAAAFAFLTSLAQRRLSTQVRLVRRRTAAVEGRLTLDGGETLPVDAELLARAPEAALQALGGGMALLAASASALPRRLRPYHGSMALTTILRPRVRRRHPRRRGVARPAPRSGRRAAGGRGRRGGARLERGRRRLGRSSRSGRPSARARASRGGLTVAALVARRLAAPSERARARGRDRRPPRGGAGTSARRHRRGGDRARGRARAHARARPRRLRLAARRGGAPDRRGAPARVRRARARGRRRR